MGYKKIIAVGSLAAIVFTGSVMNVSAAGKTTAAPQRVSLKQEQESLIIDVEAYKAAYSDLAAIFGDDREAYINHYLTVGVYEGRTKGVLFNPLAYAAAYSDVKEAMGDDIAAIVQHYITYGIAENRTQGTSMGYADLAQAVQNSAIGTEARPVSVRSAVPSSGIVTNNVATDNVITPTTNNNSNLNVASSSTPPANTAQSTPVATGNTPPAATNNTNAQTANNNYHHTTSIYNNEETSLLRVEYYDDNNKLINYSSVTNYDNDSKSYTENIYNIDNELVRTDTYVDGALSSSQEY